MSAFGLEEAECVGIAFGEHIAEPIALGDIKPRVHRVGFRAGEVDLFVGDVEVAAKNDGLLFAQAPAEGEEGFVVGEFIIKAQEFVLRIGEVGGDEIKVRKLGAEGAALVVKFRFANAFLPSEGSARILAEHGDAAIAFFLRADPARGIAFGMREDFRRNLPRACGVGVDAGLLQAEDVGGGFGEKIVKPFFLRGADAVHVPGEKKHGSPRLCRVCGAAVTIEK